jgi:hypothetical protein
MPSVTHLFAALFSLLAGAAAQEAQPPATASVRVAHLSPNAPEVSVRLAATDESEQTLTPEALRALNYRDATAYLAVPAGEYEVVLEAPAGELVETFSFSAESFYTVAAIGLVVPENLGEQTEEEGGFFGFFRNLFGDGADSRDLELRLVAYDDETPLMASGAQAGPVATDPAVPLAAPPGVVDFARMRVIHAAPGTAPISLVNTAGAASGDDVDTLVNALEYASASAYNDVAATGVADLEVRVEGSEAAALTLDEDSLTPNGVYTLFVIGTPVDEAPIETLLVGGEPTDAAEGD